MMVEPTTFFMTYRAAPGGRARRLPNLARVYTLGLDTIAGSKLLQLKFGAAASFQPDQAVLHGDRRARFIRMDDGGAMIRHWGESHPVAVPLEALSLPSPKADYAPLRAPAGARARQARATPGRARLVVRAQTGWLPGHHRQRRPLLHP